MPFIVLALLFFVLLAFAGVILLSLALRYRAGTARRQARPWVASLNVWATCFSAVFFLSFTLLLSFWVGSAFRYALMCHGHLSNGYPSGRLKPHPRELHLRAIIGYLVKPERIETTGKARPSFPFFNSSGGKLSLNLWGHLIPAPGYMANACTR